jgi:hypothetical protein
LYVRLRMFDVRWPTYPPGRASTPASAGLPFQQRTGGCQTRGKRQQT